MTKRICRFGLGIAAGVWSCVVVIDVVPLCAHAFPSTSEVATVLRIPRQEREADRLLIRVVLVALSPAVIEVVWSAWPAFRRRTAAIYLGAFILLPTVWTLLLYTFYFVFRSVVDIGPGF